MDQHLETIGAFIDGERVDSEALRSALATEEGRAYLVEVAAMREVIAVPPATAGTQRSHAGRGFSSSGAWSVKALIAAGAVVVVVGTLGFSLGVARATPTVAATTMQRAPEPTSVLKLEPGTNWKEDKSIKGGQ